MAEVPGSGSSRYFAYTVQIPTRPTERLREAQGARLALGRMRAKPGSQRAQPSPGSAGLPVSQAKHGTAVRGWRQAVQGGWKRIPRRRGSDSTGRTARSEGNAPHLPTARAKSSKGGKSKLPAPSPHRVPRAARAPLLGAALGRPWPGMGTLRDLVPPPPSGLLVKVRNVLFGQSWAVRLGKTLQTGNYLCRGSARRAGPRGGRCSGRVVVELGIPTCRRAVAPHLAQLN